MEGERFQREGKQPTRWKIFPSTFKNVPNNPRSTHLPQGSLTNTGPTNDVILAAAVSFYRAY